MRSATSAPRTRSARYYLPDLVSVYRRQRRIVATWTVANPIEIRGINSRSELAEVGAVMRQRKHEELMAAGVTLVDPATTYVDADVDVGPDTILHPAVHLEADHAHRNRMRNPCGQPAGRRGTWETR